MSTEARTPRMRTTQAWIELMADDPEAASALWVARHRLAAGREVSGLDVNSCSGYAFGRSTRSSSE